MNRQKKIRFNLNSCKRDKLRNYFAKKPRQKQRILKRLKKS